MYTLKITSFNAGHDEFETVTKQFQTKKELASFAILFINQQPPQINEFKVEVPEVRFCSDGFVNEVKLDIVESFKTK